MFLIQLRLVLVLLCELLLERLALVFEELKVLLQALVCMLEGDMFRL